jgi:glycosyltransferase involved in cell wall biosynthesis
MGITKDQWNDENQWEHEWWGDCFNTMYEESKQNQYMELMGLQEYWEETTGSPGPVYNLQGKSVLDVGGGPVSTLLRFKNKGYCAVIDPCEYPNWCHVRYDEAGIDFINKPAEEMVFAEEKTFDEAWFYNCLQHVMDPDKIIENCKKYAKKIRFFEWLEMGVTPGHPHNLTEAWLRKHFGDCGRVVDLGGFKAFAGEWTPEADKLNARARDNKFRFHLLGLAHLPTVKEISCCAYTQKNLKLSKMLMDLGHEVFFYGVEGSEVCCTEMVECLSEKRRISVYGDYDIKSNFFKGDGSDAAYQSFNMKAIEEIRKRAVKSDFLLLSMGRWQEPIVKSVADIGMKAVEAGIGYEGTFADFRVYESYAWMHNLYGAQKIIDGRYYDAVIPNYFDVDDFPYQESKSDYVLYIGRLVKRKGLEIAVEATRRAGKQLIVAGQGSLKSPNEGFDYSKAEHVKHVGSVGPSERAELMGSAQCVLVPTYYLEPFGGVAVEAQMCGTPVITSDWGAFTENMVHGMTGYRCRTIEEFVWAIDACKNIDPNVCRNWAVTNYSTTRVARMYQEYFERLNRLSSGGFYAENPDRGQLSWLNKTYP